MLSGSSKAGLAGVLAATMTLGGCSLLDRPSLYDFEPLMRDSAGTPGSTPQVWFLGTSTLVIRDDENTIMTDGFFSRPSLAPMLLLPLRPNSRRIEHGLSLGGFDLTAPRADAIFVAHSHHDHLMDTAEVAEKTGAQVIGSKSTGIILSGERRKPPFRLAQDGERFPFGNFTVTVFETDHSLGTLKALVGDVSRPPPSPRWLGDYRTRKSHAYHVEHRGPDGASKRILIVPSANYAPCGFRGMKADVVFLSIAKLTELKPGGPEEYWQRSVTDTDARVVIPIHWDDIRLPLKRGRNTVPFKTIPYAQDKFDRAMAIIMPLAARDRVTLRLPRQAGRINIEPPPGIGPSAAVQAERRVCKDGPGTR